MIILLILIVSFLVFVLVVVAFVSMIMRDKDEENDEEQLTQSLLIMTLKIFLDPKSFDCLKQSIPADSHAKFVLNEKTVKFKNVGGSLFGSNIVIVISCNEVEARELLGYAGCCPGVLASIHEAFRSAGVPQLD